MYRPTFIDALGRARSSMGYYQLNKVQLSADNTLGKFIVLARDKTSAAHKLNKLIRKHTGKKVNYSGSNLREVPLNQAKIINLGWTLGVF